MAQQNTLEITEFFSICSQIVLHSGKIIKDLFDSNNVVSKTKDDESPFTEADVKVQTLIIKSLRKIWPNIKIIGEEEEVFDKDIGFDFDSLRTDLVSKELFAGFSSTTIDLNDAIVWVDPLDATIEFIKGALDCVTTLIGISVGKESKVGVIGRYFVETEEGKYQWDPKCFFAHSDYPKLYYVDYLKNNEILELKPKPSQEADKLSICTTRNHMSADLQEKINKIQPDSIMKIGGAGNKILAVIEGRADCAFYPKAGMKRWDICAGEAVMKSVGGIVTNNENQQIAYEAPKELWMCDKGVISTLTKEKHERVMSYYLK